MLIPPKDLMQKLKIEGENPKDVLSKVQYRVLWVKHQEQEKKKEEDAKERERGVYYHTTLSSPESLLQRLSFDMII